MLKTRPPAAQSCVNIDHIACPNCTKADTALPLILSNKPTKSEADQMIRSWDMPITDRQTELPLLLGDNKNFTYYGLSDTWLNMTTKLCIKRDPSHWTYESELDENIFLPLFKTYWKQCPLFINAFTTFKLQHIHTWKLLSRTAVWSAGQRAVPLERLGWGALLKGTSVMVMRRGQVLPFTFPTHIILPAGGLNR